jgi:hypothetical protein
MTTVSGETLDYGAGQGTIRREETQDNEEIIHVNVESRLRAHGNF